MRGKVLCLLFLGCVPTPVLAEGASFGRISLYSDPAFVECTLSDSEPRNADVFLVHCIGPAVGNAYLVRFQLTASAGFTGSWVQDVVPGGMAVIGTSPNGIVINYQACRSGDVPILRATYQLFGTSSLCSRLHAAPYPGIGFIETMDCSFDAYPDDGGALVVHSDESCPCQGPEATRPSTWGQVKALYR